MKKYEEFKNIEQEVEQMIIKEMNEKEYLKLVENELIRIKQMISFEIVDLQDLGSTSEVIESLIYLKKKEIAMKLALEVLRNAVNR